LAALFTLTLEDFEFFAAPAMAGSGASTFGVSTSLAARLVVAAVFVAAAVVPHYARTAERSRAIMLLAVLAICPIALGAGAVFLPGLSTGSHARETTSQTLILGIPAICLLLAAASGFVRSALREPTGMIEAMLAASSILLAAAWAYNLLVPDITPRSVAGSECLRAGSYGLILIVALKVRAHQHRAETDEAVARERHRFTCDLHDGMAQDLALIAAHGEQLARDLGREHPIAVASRRALAASRGIISDLSASAAPSTADALRAVASELATRHRVHVNVEVGGERLTSDEREAVVRIAREAIANAAKHGRARNITVSLQTQGNQLMLRIDDDGRGLRQPVSAGPHRGYGLREMSEWAEAIGGQLTAQQGAHGGTAVKVLVS
jgi:signal transduction histidine kinase